MRSILVPVGGSDTDGSLFGTALAVARLFSSHLKFLHVRISAGEAMVNVPHAEFAMGPALSDVLEKYGHEAAVRCSTASHHFHDFCTRSSIEIRDAPGRSTKMTASWHEETGDALKRIISYARHSDLVVVGRAKRPNGMATDFIERLLMNSGRPVLVPSSSAPQALAETVMVCWRGTAEAVRALGAAMPLLAKAKRVVVTSIAESNAEIAESIGEVVRYLSMYGISAEGQPIAANGTSIAQLLAARAQACGADLVVLGAYGHSPMREAVFGGCTQSFIHHAETPVFLMH